MTRRPELDEVLPLGTVVNLKSEKDLDYMLISRGILLDENNFKDYGAVLLPIGLSKDGYKLFDATDIETCEIPWLRKSNGVRIRGEI